MSVEWLKIRNKAARFFIRDHTSRMKPFLSDVAKGLRIGFGICLAVSSARYAVVFASATWGALPDATTGSNVTSGAWNDVVSQLNALAGAISVSS